jgi:hypothetical protein
LILAARGELVGIAASSTARVFSPIFWEIVDALVGGNRSVDDIGIAGRRCLFKTVSDWPADKAEKLLALDREAFVR